MKNISEVAVIIYARLSSERVPRKMIRKFGDTTLIDLALSKVKACKHIPLENFYLCVHEPELIGLGKLRGVNVFVRSYESAHEDSKLPVLMEWWDKLPYTYCVAISACHPFLTPATMDAFIECYLESESEGMFAVVERKDYFWDSMSKLITPWPEGEDLLNTKAVGITCQAAHCFWAGRLDTIGDGKWMGSFQKPNDPALYVMENEEEALDIDFEWQFEMCEAYYEVTQ